MKPSLAKGHNSKNNVPHDNYERKPRYAILVNDMLNDFIHGKLKCDRAAKIIPKIKLILEKARQKDIPIFYCNDEHLRIDTYELKLWGPHAMKDSDGAKVIDELRPSANDYIVPKRRYSSFDGTSLDNSLGETYNGKGADTIIMTGVHTHICVKHTVYDAFVRGYDLIVAEDGVEAFTGDDHVAGLKYMRLNYGAKMEKVSDILKSIS
ncbi:MAG: nicotinamidase [Candidatus Nitrosopolaris wilkensis]|nr:MAG: nicotinamidase [Candidatus Nitrosopolaris wilkensis]